MIKKLTAMAAAMILCTAAFAQDETKAPVTFRIGIAGTPSSQINYFYSGNAFGSYSYYDFEDDSKLSTIYRDYYGPVSTSGVITLGADFEIKKWLALSIDLGITPLWHDLYNGVTDKKIGSKSGVALQVIPSAKFYYLKRSNIRLYGSIGCGVGKYFNFDRLKYSYSSGSGYEYVDESIQFEFQEAPIGLEISFLKKHFAFAEFGFGTMYCGMRAGVGYKF